MKRPGDGGPPPESRKASRKTDPSDGAAPARSSPPERASQDWHGEELREYIEAFRISSDRARFALYVVVVATVLIGIANNNLTPVSWPVKRLETWYAPARPPSAEVETAAAAEGQQAAAQPKASPSLFDNPEVRQLAREEYLRQLVRNALWTQSPIPGVWIDFNDLGTVGGIALTCLMLILVLCIVREHENLHLALFKVRRLSDGEIDRTNGDSRANLLYHGLAMRQVLSAPPSLARWRNRGMLQHGWCSFLLAPAVYLWVVWTNLQTMDQGASYVPNVHAIMTFQWILLAILTALSFTAFIYSRSMGLRWEKAFYRVNPARRHAPQMRLGEWIKLTRRTKGRPGEASLIAQLVDTLEVSRPSPANGTVEVAAREEFEGAVIPSSVRDAMTRSLMEEGERLARSSCARRGVTFGRLLRFSKHSNRITVDDGPTLWEVAGTWTYREDGPLDTDHGTVALPP